MALQEWETQKLEDLANVWNTTAARCQDEMLEIQNLCGAFIHDLDWQDWKRGKEEATNAKAGVLRVLSAREDSCYYGLLE